VVSSREALLMSSPEEGHAESDFAKISLNTLCTFDSGPESPRGKECVD
jgi:hypothetical protein